MSIDLHSRRNFLKGVAGSFGGIALADLLAADGVLSRAHHPPRAKRVVQLFMAGKTTTHALTVPDPDMISSAASSSGSSCSSTGTTAPAITGGASSKVHRATSPLNFKARLKKRREKKLEKHSAVTELKEQQLMQEVEEHRAKAAGLQETPPMRFQSLGSWQLLLGPHSWGACHWRTPQRRCPKGTLNQVPKNTTPPLPALPFT